MTTNFRTYVVNLGKYNAGRETGEWLELPMDTEVLAEMLDRITLGGNNDYAIHDYENTPLEGMRIHEYTNIYELNRLARVLEQFDEEERIIISLYAEDNHWNFIDGAIHVVEQKDYSHYSEIANTRDYGEYLVNEGYFGSIPDDILGYINYRDLGEDYLTNETHYFHPEIGLVIINR